MIYGERPRGRELPVEANIDQAWNLAWLSHPVEVAATRAGFWREVARTLDYPLGGKLVWDWMGGPAGSFSQALGRATVAEVFRLPVVRFGGPGGLGWVQIVRSRARSAAGGFRNPDPLTVTDMSLARSVLARHCGIKPGEHDAF